ncbi:ATP-binding protein [Mucilaginibacter jinjuensis]|uniref:histidine kinase n=1 Tax=Mucilaginibacter jinjuensis TaxID=1176721 RepID=A0ABY7TC35_9SPHI|nr:ATP-binding protein [Mucilaginibacter jinjuensis]WCT13886.1 ATP-binding protein [Mucilaginibacter jinjuensis]
MFRSYRFKGFTILFLSLFFTFSSEAKNKDLDSLKKIKNLDSAMFYADQLIAKAQKNHDQLQQARIIYLQSKIAYKQGKIANALTYAQHALKLTNPTDSNTYANSSTMIAYMLSKQGKDIEALKVAFKILNETEQHGWKRLTVLSQACIADIYRNMHDIKQALPYATKAADGAIAVKDSSLYLFSLSTLSNLYSDKTIRTPANMVKAIKYMEIILNPPLEHLLTSFDKARYLSNLGRLYVTVDDKRDEDVLRQSLAISQKENFPLLEKPALIELQTLYVHQKRYKEAIAYGEKALVVDSAESGINQLNNIYNHLSEAYEGLNNYKLAYQYYRKATILNDSITSIEKTKNAAELDRKYNADKRLLIAGAQTKLFQQQRNYLILLALFIAVALVATYYWLVSKRKREAAFMIKEREQLEKLDELKTRFFANISHELRTPLTLIMGPASQLLEQDVNDKVEEKRYLQTILRNGNKLLNLLNELLDLGKLEAGKLQLKLKPVALASFIKIQHEGFASAAIYKQLNYELISDIDESLFTNLDQEKFEKISNNLIGNAVKFTPSGGSIKVTVTTNNNAFIFSVANTGDGIHPDDMANIFDRYYQGHSEEQQIQGGTGIGLAIVREFTELMNGSITIDNHWKEGVTFKVTIPLVKPGIQIVATPPVVIAGDAVYTHPVTTGDKTLVMVVEDNHEMAAYIAGILSSAHTLIIANNGLQALDMLNGMQQLPKLIISDVMMPEMDGFTLLENLKQNDTYCTIPVIMLTALTDHQHKLKALHIGVDDYLTKPFFKDELMARATNLIQNAAARFEATGPNTDELLPGGTEIIADETGTLHVSPTDLRWLSELETEVRKHIGKTDLNLYMLSDAVAISERQLFRRIKAITGLTPNKYIRTIRLQIAREAIESGRYRTLAEISYAAGFDTPAYFSKLFKEHYGREVGELL